MKDNFKLLMPSQPRTSVLHIDITGRDHPGVTRSLTGILARGGARVLDVGQAVIHDALALGMLVELTDQIRSSSLLTDLLLEAHRLGVQIRFTAISTQEYETWVDAQGKGRYIVTVLGPSLTAAHLEAVSGVIADAGLNIDRIDRLSGRTPLDANGAGRMCVELGASGSLNREDEMRSALLALTQDYDVDVAFQHDTVYRRHRRLIAFDMDSTLIQTEVIDELARIAGVGGEVAAITEAAMRGELDFQASFRRRVTMLKGLPVSTLQQVIDTVPLMDGAERLTTTLRKLGYKMAILSGGFTFMGRELQRRLGIDYLHANELDISEGVVTGEVTTEIVDGPRKAHYLTEIARAEGLSMEQVIAVGDGANDLPMLRAAGLGIAFRAKPHVRQSARQALSTLGLDGILYLLGVRDREAV
jgi:phosphoserine phosphatase